MKIKSNNTSRSDASGNRVNRPLTGWRQLLQTPRFVLFLSSVFLLLVLVYLATTVTPMGLQVYKVGDLIETDIYAARSFVDDAAYEAEKQKVLDAIAPVTQIDLTVNLSLQQHFSDFFEHLRYIKTSNEGERLSVIQKIYVATLRDSDVLIDEATLLSLVVLDETRLGKDLQTTKEVIAQVMAEGVEAAAIDDVTFRILDTLEKLEVSVTIQKVSDALLRAYMRPNVQVDQAKTEALRTSALAGVEPPTVEKGALLASRGQIVDDKLGARLKVAGFGSYGNTKRIAYQVFIHLALMAIVILYYSFSYQYLKRGLSTKHIMLSTVVMVMTLLINRLVIPTSPYLAQVCFYTLILCLFYDRQYAVAVSTMLVGMSMLVEPLPIAFAVYASLSSIICGLFMREVHQRGTILLSGLVVSVFSALVGIVYLIAGGIENGDLLRDLFYLFSGGILIAILTIGSLPIWEFAFKLITPIKLLELSSPNQPLLKHLLIEAPGTYHHSIIVGNLSDEGARAIGADSLLARVGSYYHDIGKTQKPYFYKENQLGIDNPHDMLSATVSAGIIKNHVTNGVKLAQTYHLPEEIIGFIKSHHGTSTIKFFYHKAQKDMGSADMRDFVYEGDLPMTKEMAIVMLADTVEALSRTLERHDPQMHLQMLDKVFQDKMENGQLKAAPLTFEDLEKIKQAFLKTLSGLYHDRIVYPEDIKQGENVANGTVNGKRTGDSEPAAESAGANRGSDRIDPQN